MNDDEKQAARERRIGVLEGMTSEEHRREAAKLMAAAEDIQGHYWQHGACARRAQWHATMALVEQGRGR